jgi:CAAX prenyl protease-like protein
VSGSTQRQGHGWWPYLAPYGLFLILVEIGGRLPEALAPWMLPVKVAVPAAILLYFVLRGDLPELRGYRPGWRVCLDILFGVAIAALWMGPFLLFDALPRGAESDAFDPGQLGEALRRETLALRLLGFGLITPFVEELFVRSFLIRLVDVVDKGRDFRDVPIARFSWRSFLITSVWFTFTHVRWEWIVAAPTGVLFNLWLYRRRHIGATIVAHAAANASIWLVVVLGPGNLWIFL